MEQYRKLTIRDFNEHIVPDASGKRIQLYQFDAGPYQAHEFKLTFSVKTTYYSSIAHEEMIVLPVAKKYPEEIGNLSEYKIIDLPADKNLYVLVEKLTEIPETILPMILRYQFL